MSELIPNASIHKIEVVKSTGIEDETCKTFVLHHEDHTLGNSLRYMAMKNAEVEYCGYSVPHPSENKINLRIQTRTKPAGEVLKKGLVDLQKVCGHVLETFENAVAEFKERTKNDDDAEMEVDSDNEDDDEAEDDD